MSHHMSSTHNAPCRLYKGCSVQQTHAIHCMCCEGAGEENDMHLHLDVMVSTTPNPKPKRTDFLR